MHGPFAHKGTAAVDLKPPRRLPAPIDADEVREALAARPPWETQWFEIDGETASWLQIGIPFQGGVVERIETASWPRFRVFALVGRAPEPPP